jgi:hypothetical protein
VLNALRLLALPTPVLLLLRGDIRDRAFTESALDELLAPYGVVVLLRLEGTTESDPDKKVSGGRPLLTKRQVLALFDQRGDLVDLSPY